MTQLFMSKNTQQAVVTRFAPSPTGFLHIGGVRTALFSYVYAKQSGGKFVLRIEDTDKARNKEEWTTGLIEDLKWLGFEHDVFAKQSERTDIYKKYLEKMIKEGFAYISKETPKEPGDREEVIRFKNPNKKVKFTDLIRGEVEVDTADLGDFVIARSIEEPVYHLAVVVDDFEMGITHVIRAEEHLSNTPRQILIQEAIGATRPFYAHLPLVLAPDRSKLSKRKHGETVSLTYYRDRGYLPEAIINFVALLGWNPGNDEEILSMKDIIEKFRIEKVQKGGAIFNVEKLDWLNKEYIKKMPFDRQVEEVRKWLASPSPLPEGGKRVFERGGWEIDEEIIKKITPIVIDRISKWGDVKEMMERGELDYFFQDPEYKKESLLWKTEKDFGKTKSHLEFVVKVLSDLSEENFIDVKVKEIIWPYAEKEGKGNVLWPMRFALSGKDKSPDPFVLAGILGKKTTLFRLQKALEMLS